MKMQNLQNIRVQHKKKVPETALQRAYPMNEAAEEAASQVRLPDKVRMSHMMEMPHTKRLAQILP